MSKKTAITRDDILDLDGYARRRPEIRRRIGAIKAKRRVPVGPHATFYFESYDTMLYQIHEMLRAERGGEDQLKDELAAYNPMVPNGAELTATVMFEIADPDERQRFLAQLGGVEDTFFVEVSGERIAAVPEREVERTKADGKTSSVHFIHVPFSREQIARFKAPGARVLVGVEHPRYGHVAILGDETRAELATDFGD